MKTILSILLVDACLLILAAYFGDNGRESVALSILGATVLLACWQIGLFAAVPFASRVLRIENGVRTAHYVQAAVQSGLYLYWGTYWDAVGRQVPLIFVQLLFAYAVDMLLGWSRHRVWRPGFGPAPIVLSINLFLWFRDDWFYLQLGVIAAVYLGKEFITWERDGRRKHIFNPSAFALAITAVVLMATSTVKLTVGVDLILSFILPPHFFEVVFLLGLVVQFLFGTAPVTLGAATALVAAHYGSRFYYGGPASFFAIDPSVFIGITLLVTDPTTTPRSLVGKWLFGLTYGAGIFGVFILLRHLQQPSYFDKILVVPFVNLMVPWFDRRAVWVCGLRPFSRLSAMPVRYGSLASIVLLGALILSRLPPIDPERVGEFKDPLPPDPNVASPEMQVRFINRLTSQIYHLPEVYEPFNFKTEIENFVRVKEILDSRQPHQPQ